MRLDEIWKQLVKKRPALANDNATVTIRVGKLHKLLRQVYRAGLESGQAADELFRTLFHRR